MVARHAVPKGYSAVRVIDALRVTPGQLRKEPAQAVAANERLASDVTWNKVGVADRNKILQIVGLTTPRDLELGTNEALRKELDPRGLAARHFEIEAVPTREQRALLEAAKRGTAVRYVRVKRGTLAATRRPSEHGLPNTRGSSTRQSAKVR